MGPAATATDDRAADRTDTWPEAGTSRGPTASVNADQFFQSSDRANRANRAGAADRPAWPNVPAGAALNASTYSSVTYAEAANGKIAAVTASAAAATTTATTTTTTTTTGYAAGATVDVLVQ